MPQIMLMKAEYLVLLSLLLTTVVITNAFYIKKQFYPSVVYLTKSSTSLAVLYVQAFVFVILFGKLVQRIFLGQLRAIETEHLYDRAWFSITETCLAFTVFRDDFSPRFVALFAILLFLKCFHWLLEDRVDYMEQSPVLGTIFHARVVGLLSVLCLLDYLFISSAYMHTIAKGASVQIVFGFEYAILLVSVISTAIKYILHSIEIRAGEQWENKGVFMLYSDLILGFFRLTLYMIFIIVMMKIHTFPLFAIRPMFIAMRSFRKSCNDVLESRRAIRNLNTMYPDLTAEELANVADTTCIICREEMQVQQSIKRLSCQHIFHKNCLRSWFQRQQTCPICRTTVLRPTPPRAGGVAAGAAAAPPPPPPNGQPAAASQAQAQIPVSPVRFVAPPPLSPSASAAPTSSSSTSNNTTTTQTSPPNSNTMGVGIFPQIPFNPCPMVLPPFAFPPPPLPPTDFTGMSEETIRAMEGTELAHVQARIQCLRNVRTLLDASMIQMQQYMNIVLTQSNMENGPHLLSNLKNDLDQVLSSSENNNSTNNILNSMDENDADVIRRRRLEHYANRFSPSTTNQDNNNNNNNDS
ncbi:unnamed protein product [Rotaria sp. Silwood1]|nr:unnamed protein product [Rotaria sp. Silwood1]CAF0746836.1 unnamed protein product [Rotaria sp. Silwood1]CAF3328636.1 unnamed protein product [Rotaria sp. Silwood1]CAF4558585.1 unnamed protein product [Rotaria sp. Silwood1]